MLALSLNPVARSRPIGLLRGFWGLSYERSINPVSLCLLVVVGGFVVVDKIIDHLVIIAGFIFHHNNFIVLIYIDIPV